MLPMDEITAYSMAPNLWKRRRRVELIINKYYSLAKSDKNF
jgi:hypothetical protein